ncbi:MAG: permease [Deltaproteobacteria bacterium]|nr:permease [Deltaproteobacteria bacterium]
MVTTLNSNDSNAKITKINRCILLGILAVIVALFIWLLLYNNLEFLAHTVAYQLLPFSADNKFAGALNFFLYETPKIFLLLTVIIFGVGVVRSFFTPERTRSLLAGRREFFGNILAALLGVVTPFCSCSAVPLFIGFVAAGVPLGVTFSFLIAAPMVNEVALVLLFGLFGYKIAGLYLITGLTIAIIAGWVIGKLPMQRWVEDWVIATVSNTSITSSFAKLTFYDRLQLGRDAVFEIIGKVWPYIILGIAVGAGIHGFVPQNFMAAIMGKSAWWSVPIAVVMGVPMYANAAGIIPIVQALLSKGAALGTVLAFMMSVIALSLPEMIILRKVLKLPAVLTFAAIVALGILSVGYIFNFIL